MSPVGDKTRLTPARTCVLYLLIMSTTPTINSSISPTMPEVVLRNQTANDIRFTLEYFPLTHFVSHYFYKVCGKMTPLQTQETIHARICLPHAPLFPENFIFFCMRGRHAKQNATPEQNIWSAFSTHVCDIEFGA